MKNRLLMVSISALLLQNICFAMEVGSDEDKARDTIYDLVKGWQKVKDRYKNQKEQYKQELKSKTISKNTYKQKIETAEDDEIIDFNYTMGEIRRALNNYTVPEPITFFREQRGNLLSKLQVNGTLSTKDVQSLMKKYFIKEEKYRN